MIWHLSSRFSDTNRGAEYVPIYNAAFVPLAGATHPTLMGSTFKQGFPELWQGISPLFEMAATSGIAADVLEAPMTVERNGYPEETFFTGNFTPIRDADGQIAGYYNALFEVTKQKITERRTSVLNMIAAPTELTTDSVYRHIMSCLETNDYDVTMAMMYSIDGEDESRNVFRLSGNIGVPESHPLLVDNQNWISNEGILPLCRTARSKAQPLLTIVDSRFDGINWRGPGGPSKSVAIIKLTSGIQLLGFLIIGTNPRLLDDQNAQFLQDLGRITSGVLASAVSVEQSRLRQQRLERDLANSDMKIQHLVQHASVGMLHLLLNGTMIWANNQYFDIVGQSRSAGQSDYGFFDNVLEADLPIAEDSWQKVVNSGERVSCEIRLNRLYNPPAGAPVPATVLLLAFPYSQDDTVLSVMAVFTDVSRLKWAENWQARIAQDAQEAKRQQEAFIDIVSHEMRNPLSAIMHCADSIVATSQQYKALPPEKRTKQKCEDALEEAVSAAQIVEVCAKHQRHILDSVLTLGRLESSLLSITPEPVSITSFCESVLSMFKKEVQKTKIDLSLQQHHSYATLNVDQVLADPTRLTQIIVNLMTNAIKFVRNEPRKAIAVTYGGCATAPRATFPDAIHWAPRGDHAQDATRRDSWGDNEQIYITFQVRDTGIGVDANQRNKIFARFNQANVKTHVFYGGSGLGLFVSKQLAERQGGEIGVMQNEDGPGSTFAFYVRVRRAQRPQTPATVETASTPLPKPVNDEPRSNSHALPVLVKQEISELPTARSKAVALDSAAGTDSITSSHHALVTSTALVTPPIRLTKSSVSPIPPSKEETIHVLLVEDNIINQQVLRKQLVRHGCVVHVANHGIEALQHISQMQCHAMHQQDGVPIDVILMDVQMPVMGGVECTKEIRRLQREGTITRHVPVIAVTANTRAEQVDEITAAGAVGNILSPS